MMEYKDLLDKSLSEIDTDTKNIIHLEDERQKNKIILIPSESICPAPVREALASRLSSIYAEGYPALRMRRQEEKELLDFDRQLAYYRRYANRRFYKGCEYADFIESLARKRIARCFATTKIKAEDIFVNVQPLSGAAANNSVYEAFCNPGDTVMGMALAVGGHLTHGSSVNRSGKRYHIISYGVNPKTEKLDYEEIEKLALKYKPKMIIAGYTSYSWAPDWKKFREIASRCNALLFADISHPAGLVIAGFYPTPVGYADVITFTTHKTIGGPRGAVILTTDKEKAKKIDKTVFPGEQGGPHVNKFAAMAVAFKIAGTKEFYNLQKRIVKNCKTLATGLQNEGLRLAYGGTNTHLLVIDLKNIVRNGYSLKGEPASRILDIAGIVTNKNTIPGDRVTAQASGIRLGTPWVTQRGFGTSEIKRLAKVIATVLKNIKPFFYLGLKGKLPRGKIDFEILEKAKKEVKAILGEKKVLSGKNNSLSISGERAETFLQQVVTSDVSSLKVGEFLPTLLFDGKGLLLDVIAVKKEKERFLLFCSSSKKLELVESWLKGLSDGYIIFDEDILAKINGPVKIRGQVSTFDKIKLKINIKENDITTIYSKYPHLFSLSKPYFIGQKKLRDFILPSIPSHQERGKERIEKIEKEGKRTSLYSAHLKRGAKMTNFAGWEMPISYSGIIDEHQAVRKSAGLFDIGHMGIIEIRGKGATNFLNIIATNYIWWLKNMESLYSFVLGPDGNVLDDVMVYKRSQNNYFLVCNSVNEEKIWGWLNAVSPKKVTLKNLRGEETILALQGPDSLSLLKKVIKESDLKKLERLEKRGLIATTIAGKKTTLAYTGYTGEKIGFELYLAADDSKFIWNLLLEEGRAYGIVPAGLGARDSLRIEAMLPLYGHELAGKFNISPIEAGLGFYVKFHKPYFIGREALLKKKINKKVVSFEMLKKAIPRKGYPVISGGKKIGEVTSGTFSPSANKYIGLAYVDLTAGREFAIEVRGKNYKARIKRK